MIQDILVWKCPAKFQLGASVTYTVHDVGLVEGQGSGKLGLIIEADLVNPSPRQFEKILDNEAQRTHYGRAADLLFDFARECFGSRLVKLHAPARQDPERVSDGAMNEDAR